jgi:hypothetical protein
MAKTDVMNWDLSRYLAKSVTVPTYQIQKIPEKPIRFGPPRDPDFSHFNRVRDELHRQMSERLDRIMFEEDKSPVIVETPKPKPHCCYVAAVEKHPRFRHWSGEDTPKFRAQIQEPIVDRLSAQIRRTMREWPHCKACGKELKQVTDRRDMGVVLVLHCEDGWDNKIAYLVRDALT